MPHHSEGSPSVVGLLVRRRLRDLLHLLERAPVDLPLLLHLPLGQALRVRSRRVVDERVLEQRAEHERDADLRRKKET